MRLLVAVLVLGVFGLLGVTIVGAFRTLLDPGDWVGGDSESARRSRRRWVIRVLAAAAVSSSFGFAISTSWIETLSVALGIVAAIAGVLGMLELSRRFGSTRLERTLRAGVMARIAVEPLILVDLALGAVAYGVAALVRPDDGDFSILRLSLACVAVNFVFMLGIGWGVSWMLWPPEVAVGPWRSATQRAVKRTVRTS